MLMPYFSWLFEETVYLLKFFSDHLKIMFFYGEIYTSLIALLHGAVL